MKSMVLLALALFTVTEGFAAERISADRANFQAAEARALRDGKKIVYRLSGAWCAICSVFDIFMEKHRAELAGSLANYEWVEFEETWRELPWINDAVRFEVQFLPTFYVIDPVTGKTGFISARFLDDDRLEYFQGALDAFAERGDLTEWTVIRYETGLAAGKQFGTDGTESYFEELEGAYWNVALNRSPVEVVAFMNEMKAKAAAHPDQYLFSEDSGYTIPLFVNIAYLKLLERGTPLEEIRALDPEALTRFDDYFMSEMDVTVVQPIKLALANGGYSAAGVACRTVVPTLADDLMKFGGEVLCLTLRYMAGEETTDTVRAFLATVSPELQKRVSRSLTALAATSGNFDYAVTFENFLYEGNLEDFKDSAVLIERIKTAHAARLAAFAAGKARP